MNYREQEANGTEWRRCHQVHIYNALETVPHCRFDEETVVSVGGRQMAIPDGYITKDFDAAAGIALLDPQTGQPTGQSMTHEGLYQVLYSLYMQTATERDVQEAQDSQGAVA